MFLLQTQYSF